MTLETEIENWKKRNLPYLCFYKCTNSCCSRKDVVILATDGEARNILSIRGGQSIQDVPEQVFPWVKEGKKTGEWCIRTYFGTDMPHCPVYNPKTKKCGIYDERPKMCRTYPISLKNGTVYLDDECVASKDDKALGALKAICEKYGMPLVINENKI